MTSRKHISGTNTGSHALQRFENMTNLNPALLIHIAENGAFARVERRPLWPTIENHSSLDRWIAEEHL